MDLEELLQRDADAARLFQTLPGPIQEGLRYRGEAIGSLAALREYAANVVAQSQPNYNDRISSAGIPLDPKLAAHWTKAHET